jgi:hypothetical protein
MTLDQGPEPLAEHPNLHTLVLGEHLAVSDAIENPNDVLRAIVDQFHED